ncbi:MAG: hypothetical protein COB65_11455, partial [Thalassobium sp.]
YHNEITVGSTVERARQWRALFLFAPQVRCFGNLATLIAVIDAPRILCAHPARMGAWPSKVGFGASAPISTFTGPYNAATPLL